MYYKTVGYKIIGVYNGTSEEIDIFDTEEEAEKMLAEYRLAYGDDWYLYIREKKVICG